MTKIEELKTQCKKDVVFYDHCTMAALCSIASGHIDYRVYKALHYLHLTLRELPEYEQIMTAWRIRMIDETNKNYDRLIKDQQAHDQEEPMP